MRLGTPQKKSSWKARTWVPKERWNEIRPKKVDLNQEGCVWTCMGESMNVYTIFVGKLYGRRSL
jgi:hypothetical protein